MRKFSKYLSAIAATLTVFMGSALAQSNLRPGDKVMISIAGVPASEQSQINKEYAISEDGTINLVYLKAPIMAAGRSTSELESAIEAAYRGNEIYTNPTITCGSQQGARFVDTAGQVRSPTRVPYTEDLTLMSAISASGGLTQFANLKDIQIIRGGRSTKYDYKGIQNGKQPDPRLSPGDKIVVGESWF